MRDGEAIVVWSVEQQRSTTPWTRRCLLACVRACLLACMHARTISDYSVRPTTALSATRLK
eukprot:4735816-Alexandrium_andersonii.AAC.1